jgi:hypothetical protein
MEGRETVKERTENFEDVLLRIVDYEAEVVLRLIFPPNGSKTGLFLGAGDGQDVVSNIFHHAFERTHDVFCRIFCRCDGKV